MKTINVLFLSSEAAPFAKTGGLADVAGALPLALRKLGLDVRTALPLYRQTRERDFDMQPLLKDMGVPFGAGSLPADVMACRLDDGAPVYLIQRDDLYDRSHLYGDGRGDYYDNLERFAFFSHAALCMCQELSFRPDVIHCHDWQTGLAPALLKGPYAKVTGLSTASTMFTIHNIGYQGSFPAEKLPVTGLSYETFFAPEGV